MLPVAGSSPRPGGGFRNGGIRPPADRVRSSRGVIAPPMPSAGLGSTACGAPPAPRRTSCATPSPRPIAASVVACSPLALGRAQAAPITYTETTVASGSLSTTAFTNGRVTLSFVGDTAGVVSPAPGVFINPAGTASVAVDGVGTGVFDAGGQASIVFQEPGGAAIGANSRDPDVDQSGQTYVLALDGPAFATYDLSGPIGPVVGPAVLRPGLAFSTSAGDFVLTSAGDVTYTATLGTATGDVAAGATAVPEPAGLALLGVGLLGLGLTRRRRTAA